MFIWITNYSESKCKAKQSFCQKSVKNGGAAKSEEEIKKQRCL